jgi:nucleoid DNA-binding protein
MSVTNIDSYKTEPIKSARFALNGRKDWAVTQNENSHSIKSTSPIISQAVSLSFSGLSRGNRLDRGLKFCRKCRYLILSQRHYMTKRDLVVRISNDTGMIQQDVLTVVQRALDILSESMAEGETIELRNFGVFEVTLRKARIGRNPNAPKTDVRIPPRAVVKFKPGKELKSSVLKLSDKLSSANSSLVSKPTEVSTVHPVSSPVSSD